MSAQNTVQISRNALASGLCSDYSDLQTTSEV